MPGTSFKDHGVRHRPAAYHRRASPLRQDLEPLFDERFQVFLEWLDAYRGHLQTTKPNAEKRQEILREVVAKVKLQARIEFPKVERRDEQEQKGMRLWFPHLSPPGHPLSPIAMVEKERKGEGEAARSN